MDEYKTFPSRSAAVAACLSDWSEHDRQQESQPQGIPTRLDIQKLGRDNATIHMCIMVGREMGLTPEQFYRLCIVELARQNEALLEASAPSQRLSFELRGSAPV